MSFSYSMSAAKSSAFSDATCERNHECPEGTQRMRRISDEFDSVP